ncbi:MAG TPA: ABC transporter substrate-binding protein [Chloroflexota bacterium]|nr:ABC transporter substrate-binding protein [Chloroflexota bacterium]
MNVTLPGPLDTLNPLLSRSATVRAMAGLVFAGLLGAAPDGRPIPSLATSWSSADDLTWTFHLDPSRRWQDGGAVTSQDVAFTLTLVQALDSPVDPSLHAAWQGIEVHTPDSSTVLLTVPATLGAGVLDLATISILPAHLLASTPLAALRMAPFSSHPIGDGPYRVASADSLGATLLSDQPGSLAPRRLNILSGGGSRTEPTSLPVATGSVTLEPNTAGPPDGADSVVTLARPVFVFLNTRDATLGDARVRQALSLAIDRQSLVAGPVHSTGVALRGPLLPGMWAADAAAVAPPNSVAAASQALDAAGWLSNGHGERLRAGAALTVTLLVDNDPTRLAVAQAVAMRWQAIGVTANVEVVGLDGMFRDFLAPGHYQAALIGLRQRGALPDLTDLWHSGGALNISAWTDPLADAALDATRDADAATRQIGYTRFARRFVDEMPAIPLYLPTVPFAVRGLRLPMTTVNDPADVLTSAESWRPVP